MDPDPIFSPAAALEQILQTAQRSGSGWVLVALQAASSRVAGGAALASCVSQGTCDFFLLSFFLFCCLWEPELTMVG